MNVVSLCRFVCMALSLSMVVFPGMVLADQAPTGQTQSTTELFGAEQGYFHPSFKVATEYTDNYYNSPTDEDGDWLTTISPALWVAVPASSMQFLPIVTSTDAPGGLGVTRFQQEGLPGFQSALLYRADIERHPDHSEDNTVNHTGQGTFQYNFSSGLTIEASDIYQVNYDDFAKGSTASRQEYRSNLANAILYYQVSSLLKLRAGYSNYNLDYDTFTKSFKDRVDNEISTYVLYQLLPKTQMFVQYDHIDTDFDLSSRSDSLQQHYFLGLKFDSTARIDGHVKLGYGVTETDLANDKDYHDFIGEASLGYGFGEGSKLSLDYRRQVNISSSVEYQNFLHSELTLGLYHKLSQKVGLTLYASLMNDDYRGGSAVLDRDDDFIAAGAGLKYTMREWLVWNIAYDYLERDSNQNQNDYASHVALLSAELAF